MDCLDRTNVVQSMLANENLNLVLRQFGLLKDGCTTAMFPDFQQLFRHVWADHANLLAIQYAGSGAMKTDFTRTGKSIRQHQGWSVNKRLSFAPKGKRTVKGALEDLKHAMVRYWKNNFYDGHRQDAIDLFLGTTTETNVKGIHLESDFVEGFYHEILYSHDCRTASKMDLSSTCFIG